MPANATGKCLVCYVETKNRCSRCGQAGIDLFFCSPEHQKLAWQGHRLFCGPSAYPLAFPGLSDEELTAVVENLYKPQSMLNGGLSRPSDIFSRNGRMTPELLEEFIQAKLTRTSPQHQESPAQYLLMCLRIIYPLESLSLPAQLLSQFSKVMYRFVTTGIISNVMLSHPWSHCELLHRIFTVMSLTEHDRKLPTPKDVPTLAYSGQTLNSYRALRWFIEDEFEKAFASQAFEIVESQFYGLHALDSVLAKKSEGSAGV